MTIDSTDGTTKIKCPRCGNTDGFAGYLAVSVDINYTDCNYVATWSEGIEFEARCALCGTPLSCELSDQLYADLEINI